MKILQLASAGLAIALGTVMVSQTAAAADPAFGALAQVDALPMSAAEMDAVRGESTLAGILADFTARGGAIQTLTLSDGVVGAGIGGNTGTVIVEVSGSGIPADTTFTFNP